MTSQEKIDFLRDNIANLREENAKLQYKLDLSREIIENMKKIALGD